MNMLKQIKKVLLPLLSTFFMIGGITLYMIALPLHLETKYYSVQLIGIISAAGYTGMIFGAFNVESQVADIGHIRSFVVFMALMIIATIIPILIDNVFLWILGRFLVGFSLSGLYIVLESWFLSAASDKTRGFYLAWYMIALGVGEVISPFLLNLGGDASSIIPFIIVLLCLSLAIIPFAMERGRTPEVSTLSNINLLKLWKICPIGMIGCFISGYSIASFQSLLPITLGQVDFTIFQITVVVSILLSGNLVFQYPVGYLSDYYNRFYVILLLCIIGIIGCVMAIFAHKDYSFFHFISVFIVGGVVFSLYPISISVTCDQVSSDDITKMLQGVLLVYALGSVLGPLTAPPLIKAIGPQGLYIANIIPISLFGLYTLFSLNTTKTDTHNIYPHTIMPTTTPVATEFAPSGEELETRTSG